MDPMTIVALLSAGTEAYRAYKGGREKREYKFSPYEQMVIDYLMKEYKGGLPSWLTAPYHGEARRLEQRYARHPGLSGVVSGIKARDIYGPMAEAGERYRSQLMSMIGGLTRGTGETVFTEPKDYSSALWDLGYALRSMKGLKKGKGQRGGVDAGGYSGYYPSPYRPGRERSLDRPYLWD